MDEATHVVQYALGKLQADRNPVPEDSLTEARKILGNELSRQFGGCTIYETTGFWQGQEEPSLVFESFGTFPDVGELRRAATAAATIARQEAVMVLVQHIEAELYFEGPKDFMEFVKGE
jgi:hypothetical protein